MNAQTTLQVVISGPSGKTTQGTVAHQVWDKKERMTRGLKALGFSWGLALAAVLIPLLHFILVPTLLLAGPVVFFWIVKQEQIILGGKGECPECRKEFEIVRSAVEWPLSDLCNHCQAPVKISLAMPENQK
jgi:hypothetical protein